MPSLHALVRHHAPAGKESTVYGYNSSAIFLGNMMGPIVGGFLTVWIDIRGLFLVTAGLLLLGAWWIKTGSEPADHPQAGANGPSEKGQLGPLRRVRQPFPMIDIQGARG